jgi:hypothetical protein
VIPLQTHGATAGLARLRKKETLSMEGGSCSEKAVATQDGVGATSVHFYPAGMLLREMTHFM